MSNRIDKTKKKYYGHPDFYKIMDELKELHSVKNKQYATSDNPLGNFERTGNMIKKFLKPNLNPTLVSAMCLVSKQIDAVYEMVGENKKDTYEELSDKFRDIAIYSVICMIICGEKNEN